MIEPPPLQENLDHEDRAWICGAKASHAPGPRARARRTGAGPGQRAAVLPVRPRHYLYARDRRALYDMVLGNDKYVSGWRAHRGYDLASGLGVPQFA